MKVVINKCYGGFSLSPKAISRLAELQGKKAYHFKNTFTDNSKESYSPWDESNGDLYDVSFSISNPSSVKHKELWDRYYLTNRPNDRADKLLIQVVEELGREADGNCAELAIVEIPNGTEYYIDEYDGIESIHEVHRIWS